MLKKLKKRFYFIMVFAFILLSTILIPLSANGETTNSDSLIGSWERFGDGAEGTIINVQKVGDAYQATSEKVTGTLVDLGFLVGDLKWKDVVWISGTSYSGQDMFRYESGGYEYRNSSLIINSQGILEVTVSNGTDDNVIIGSYQTWRKLTPITLQNIAITTSATKLSYTVGDSLNISGLVVTGTYSDGSTKVESITAANVTGFNSAVAATDQVLTITVSGKTVTYKVQIVEEGYYPWTGNVSSHDISVDKEWKIHFSQAVDESSLTGNILIKDAGGNLFPISTRCYEGDSSSKTVILSHNQNFSYGSSYSLYISKKLCSKIGQSGLKQGWRLDFSTVAQPSTGNLTISAVAQSGRKITATFSKTIASVTPTLQYGMQMDPVIKFTDGSTYNLDVKSTDVYWARHFYDITSDSNNVYLTMNEHVEITPTYLVVLYTPPLDFNIDPPVKSNTFNLIP